VGTPAHCLKTRIEAVMATPLRRIDPVGTPSTGAADFDARLGYLRALERKLLWLSSWTIHNANHLRPSRDGLKVGGHQASSASLVSILTALYFDVLKPEDRIAVKPHAAPVFHAIQYLLGRLDRDSLVNYRALGGVQPYPSRTKDPDDVDFSGGSMGLGVAQTIFSSLAQDYVRLQGLAPPDLAEGRLVAMVGDAELDEGNVFEALLEGWKKDLRNTWWIVDYNRQSLDSVVSDRLFGRIDKLFEAMGWRVVELKYGRRLQRAFARQGGDALMGWIDNCPNSLYSALTFKGGAAWREHLGRDLGDTAGIKSLLDDHDDAALHGLMTNLAGNDLETVLEAFHAVTDDTPTCFIGYTIKGYGLPFAGHKDNHSGLMNPDQMDTFKSAMGIADGAEWDPFAGLEYGEHELRRFLAQVPFAARYPRRHKTPHIAVPATLDIERRGAMSTQEGFGRILSAIARRDDDLARRIVTASPDVTVSTNLGPWVNRQGVFHRIGSADTFADEDVVSAQKWVMSPGGQHFELGIAEHNLFLALSALGLAGEMFGARLLPVGTLYDPFIRRGLDALHYGCYQGARYMLVATPSGITLAPEGGAHQSHETPLITLAQPGLATFEPAFVDELAAVMRWGFEHMQAEDGGSVCLRLSTLSLDQPDRELGADGIADVIAGAYWLAPPAPGTGLVIAYSGAVAPQAIAAHAQILEDIPGAGLLAVTSSDRLHANWMTARRARISGHGAAAAHIEGLLTDIAPDAALVTVIDAHPASLSWLGSVAGHRIYPLGVDRFGQAGDIPDLYREYGIDSDAILDAAARACIRRNMAG
jgi:pyruvate dehydrogenase E1 component